MLEQWCSSLVVLSFVCAIHRVGCSSGPSYDCVVLLSYDCVVLLSFSFLPCVVLLVLCVLITICRHLSSSPDVTTVIF